MDLNDKIKQLEALKAKLEDCRLRVLPVKTGNLAVNHFKGNFRKGGYQDGGLTPWKKAARQLNGRKDTDSSYGTLLSRRNHLMNSTRFIAEPGKVTVINDVPYAKIHNEGGVITQPITPKMRKFAWAKYFQEAGVAKADSKEKRANKIAAAGQEAERWKGLALTKKTTIRQIMPRRQFMGRANELMDNIYKMAENEIRKLLTNM